jgi:outer membrane protein TolC
MSASARCSFVASALVAALFTHASSVRAEGPPAAVDAAPTEATILAGATGVAGGLTADQVARAARASSPGLAARRAELEAAAAAVDQARAGYLPRVALTARYVRLSDFTPPTLGSLVVAPGSPDGPIAAGTALVNAPIAFPVRVDQTTFQAQLAIPISDDVLRVARAVAAARHGDAAARLTEAADDRRIAAEARLAYYGWARARLSALVAAEAVGQADQHLADVRQRAAADRASTADVMRVQSQRAAAEQLRVRTEDLARVAETQLRILLRDERALAIGEDLAVDLPLPVTPAAEAAVDEAIGARLELRALDESTQALREQARATRAGALPRLDLIADVTAADPNPRYVPAEDTFHTTWSVGAQVTWTISDAPAQLAAARGLSARAAATAAQRAALVDAVRIEVAQADAAVRDAASAQVTSRDGLASAEESYRVRRALFREGQATSTELTDAETELTRARLDAVAARIDARIAAVRYAHALGRDGGG